MPQYVVHLVSAREVAADAEADAAVLLRAEQFGDVLQSVMPAGAPLRAHPEGSERQGDVIDDDQQILTRNLLRVEPVADGLARKVHVGRGLEQHQRMPFAAKRGHGAVAVGGKRGVGCFG